MTTTAADWQAGHRSLEARIRAIPRMLREGLARMRPLEPPLTGDAHRFVVTGVGSSAAHARFLACLLREALALDAQAVPLSAFLDDTRATPADAVLIVISQGLSPNARLALSDVPAWRRVVVLTAATEDGVRAVGDHAKAAVLAELRAAGVAVCPFPAGENEYETLVRVVGPMAGYVAALHLAREMSRDPTGRVTYDAAPICDAIATAPGRIDRMLGGFDVARLADGVAFLTSGTYREVIENLRYKVVEGMLLPAPPAWDLLDVAHGPLQQAYTGRTTFIALTRPDVRGEGELLARIERALDPERHALLRFDATLAGPLAIFEHEALMNELMLRFIARRQIDQISWPGRDRDRVLYDVGGDDASRDSPRVAPVPADPTVAKAREARLEQLTWPEVDALLREGPRVAVVPLGSTEQHGPHLPYATDTWIADAIAARFCARVPEAIQCPTIALGCSSEHAAFPGTLDLRTETLRAVLLDVLRSLRQHGFAAAFLFSAHGGNYGVLRDALPELRDACAPMRLIVYADLDALTAEGHRLSATFGVGPEASGHHAGELETSIIRALRPDAVRTSRIEAGLVTSSADPQALFYPSLRDHAPTGVVGDPRGAAAERGESYLDGWVALLIAAYRREYASK